MSNVIIKFRSALTASLASMGLSGLVDCWFVSHSSFASYLHLFVILGCILRLGLLDCARKNEDFVISRFCSIHFTVTLAGLKNIVRYTEGSYIEVR